MKTLNIKIMYRGPNPFKDIDVRAVDPETGEEFIILATRASINMQAEEPTTLDLQLYVKEFNGVTIA